MNDFGYTEEGKIGSVGDFGLWGRILVFSSRYRGALNGAVLLSLLVTAASLVLPYLMQTGIDKYIATSALALPERIHGILRLGSWYGSRGSCGTCGRYTGSDRTGCCFGT